ncbi:TPA: hypothetical protein ACMDXT_000163 [Vibrio parahaemolyticus]|uniref:hypothetical protein n=1 Tax=Vibrio alginolyticus TaxID=663 RepID=UPI003ABB11AE|nr:hypothetical protein [Vibrio parahaemolyticus]MDG2593024.1 hypothetical protein [Vibrio parahaemolyticus]
MKRTAILLSLISAASVANAANYPYIECEDLKIDIEEHGTSDLNGLTFTSIDTLDRMTVPKIEFSFGSNVYIELNDRKQYKMFDVIKEGNKYSFTTTKEKNNLGIYVDRKNAFSFEITDLGNGEYTFQMFKARYEGSYTDKKVVWVPYNKFVQGDDFETPVRYAVDESSIDARNEFKCEN